MAAARPEPMNATPVHAKTRVTLAFSDPLFVAGQHVTGKMELECRADKGLGIGLMKAELFAIQELTSRDHSATSTFLHLTRCFQGPSLPPSNAVLPYPLPGSEPLPLDYYPARKGITTFFFRFPIPSSSPASIDFGKGLARLKYEVRASVDVAWKGERQTVMERREVDVVEAVGEPAAGTEQVTVGENGKIWMQGRIANPFLVAGSSACVELFVKNHSAKKSSGLNLTVTRHLQLPPMVSAAHALQISDALLNVPFRGPDFIVQPGTEGVANLVFTIPKTARGVRTGRLDTGEDDDNHIGLDMESLFTVQCIITVKMAMGIGTKDITLEIPITVVHPAAMALVGPPSAPPFASFQPQRQNTPDRYASPMPIHNRVSPPQQLFPYRSPYISPPLSPQPTYYQAPYHRPPVSPPLQHINHWMPPQSLMQMHPHDEPYYYPPPSPVPQAPLPPLRPSSADPFVAQQLPLLPQQQQAVNNLLVAPSPSLHPLPDEVAEGEAGKGERASRISAHLRHSSRNRSVSPQSHRFPAAIPMVITESTDEGTTVAPLSAHASRPLPVPSPKHSRKADVPQDAAFLSASLTSNPNGEILSPRPVLSPKHSFSIDRGTVKSERVEHLEQMVAEEVETEAKVRPEVEQEMAFIDVQFETEGTPRLPPQPTLSPVAIPPRLNGTPPESGLDALERKLLSQVGTRKPEPTRRTDVRSVMPITIPSPSDPRCDPPNESAISSLALGADFLRDDSKWPSVTSDDRSERQEITGRPLPSLPAGKAGGKPAEPRRIANNREEKRSEAQELRKAATGRVAAWLGGIEHAATPAPCGTPPFGSPLALSSVSDVDKAEHDLHPLLRSPANDIVRELEQEDHGVVATEIPTRSSGFVLHATLDSSPFSLPIPVDENKADKFSNQLVNDVENGTTRAESGNIPKPVLKRFTLQAPSSDVKYDIRSARGGRGGKVASVAAIWTSMTTPNDPQGRRNLPPPPHNTSVVPRTKTSPTLPRRTKTPTPGPVQPNHATSNINLAELTTRRAKMIKSTSVPAVISSSHATPMISSTASLARPGPSVKKVLPPTATAATSVESRGLNRSTPTTGGTNFGQARLKDLIRKYQQGQ